MIDVSYNDWPDLYEAPLGEVGNKYIFISYSHKDTEVVYQDLKELSSNGARVWYDRAMRAGQDWVERAKNKIFDKNCGGVIFYVSENSLQSPAFLQELEYAIERQNSDEKFVYISVNIGEKTAFNILKSIDVDESAFLKAVLAFNGNKLFIPRKRDPFDTTHIVRLIDFFKETDAIDVSKCTISQTQLFDYSEYEQGIQIIRYRGSDSVVNLSASFNGKKVIAIGINCFKNNTAVKKVNVPEGIRVIDDFAFSGCTNLESIILPNSIISLGYEAFRECYSLKEIIIPYNVKRIGDYCFYKCHHLKNIALLSIVPLSIEFAAFSECHAADKIILPESTENIGPYAFNNCINISSIVIPQKVRRIGLSAFYNCASLNSVIIKTEKALECNKLFARCRSLKQIMIDAGQMQQYLEDDSWRSYIGKMTFKLSSPSNITFESGILSWDSVDSADYYTIHTNGKVIQTSRPLFAITDQQNEKNIVISIVAHSYDDRIADSDASIEFEVAASHDTFEIFSDGEDVVLEKYNGNTSVIVIPKEVTRIGDNAFYNHEEIKEVKFSEGLLKIGNRAFYHCLNLHKISFPNSLLEIGNEAFWGASFKELTIPMNVTKIGKSCFACCNSLEELTIMPADMIAGEKAFYRCISLKRVHLPDGFKELYNGMFRGCTELEDLVLPTGLKAIRGGSISYIMRLQRVLVPNSVQLIERGAFSNSFGLTEIYVDERNDCFFDRRGVLFSKEGNRLIHFPANKEICEYIVDDDVSEISDFAFMDAEHLEKVTIGRGTRIIGESAFERCPSLYEIVINGEVEAVRRNAFRDCIGLKRIFLMSGVVPEIETGVFDNAAAGFKIIVPEKYIKNYLRITDWRDYHYLIEPLRTEENAEKPRQFN